MTARRRQEEEEPTPASQRRPEEEEDIEDDDRDEGPSGRMGRRFTSEENAALVDEVIVQWDVLFGCRSHRINAARRKKIWQLVTDKVNAVGAVHRDRNTVYKRFSDLKRWIRAKFAARRAKAQKTGGGTLPSLRLQPYERRLLDIMGREVCEGLEGSLHDTDWRNCHIILFQSPIYRNVWLLCAIYLAHFLTIAAPPRTAPQPTDSDQDQDLDPLQPQEEGEAADSPRGPQAQEHRAPRRAQSPAVIPVVPPRRHAAEAGAAAPAAEAGAAAPAAAAPIGGPPQEQPQRLGVRHGDYIGLLTTIIRQQRRQELWMRRWFALMHGSFRESMQSMEQTMERNIQDLVATIRELAHQPRGFAEGPVPGPAAAPPPPPASPQQRRGRGRGRGQGPVRGDKRKRP
ncbi:myb-related transcription factor, partner of profilin-like [Xenopus laevis]|uniref:Myb-related transcription factor, partner of profilin-like n=1 Tax=Xenopus laevis TaxID=8355 RepID=A0A8J1LN40_XENLA|nr:myb-related transcription factor, partner of profilin-like [Xenopus laevis]